jgi:hypothetical protein
MLAPIGDGRVVGFSVGTIACPRCASAGEVRCLVHIRESYWAMNGAVLFGRRRETSRLLLQFRGDAYCADFCLLSQPPTVNASG